MSTSLSIAALAVLGVAAFAIAQTRAPQPVRTNVAGTINGAAQASTAPSPTANAGAQVANSGSPVNGAASATTSPGVSAPGVVANPSGVSATGSTVNSGTNFSTAAAGSGALASAQITATNFAERNQLTQNVESRVDTAAQSVANIRARSEPAGANTNPQFQAALAEAGNREAQVRAALRQVQTATIDNYSQATAQLAQSYDAYAQTIATLEATSSANTAPRP